ncbi:MAG: choice-of-anchor B family protein [Flavobacteriales bacterium]|jgi:choice-of-anchor B domain-containing protein|nr:choice-of-anchor B family protein [Flavobacteriales bacterium]
MKSSLIITLLLLSVQLLAQIKNVMLLDNWDDNDLITTYDDESVFNECWGFVHNNEEYAVIGSTVGTHFFRITPTHQLQLIDFKEGKHSSHEIIHRDYHDYQGYLYEVADEGLSSLRIYDLQYLPDSVHIISDSDSLIVRSHNIFIDSSAALLYSCGNTSHADIDALKVISLADPTQPTQVYDYNFINYVHDIYVRNDTAYLNVPGDGLIVLDFSNPTMPIPLGNLPYYVDQGYTHSGWLNEQGNLYVLCDENQSNRFKVCDVSDLSNIEVLAATKPETYENTIPHNVMIRDNLAYFSYYNDGLQIYDISIPDQPERIAYYDTYDGPDNGDYRGAWGIYCLFPSERILISDRKNGLFLLRHTPPPEIHPEDQDAHGIYPNPANGELVYFYYDQPVNYNFELKIYNDLGQHIETYNGNQDFLKLSIEHYAQGGYIYEFYSAENDKRLSGKFIKR